LTSFGMSRSMHDHSIFANDFLLLAGGIRSNDMI